MTNPEDIYTKYDPAIFGLDFDYEVGGQRFLPRSMSQSPRRESKNSRDWRPQNSRKLMQVVDANNIWRARREFRSTDSRLLNRVISSALATYQGTGLTKQTDINGVSLLSANRAKYVYTRYYRPDASAADSTAEFRVVAEAINHDINDASPTQGLFINGVGVFGANRTIHGDDVPSKVFLTFDDPSVRSLQRQHEAFMEGLITFKHGRYNPITTHTPHITIAHVASLEEGREVQSHLREAIGSNTELLSRQFVLGRSVLKGVPSA